MCLLIVVYIMKASTRQIVILLSLILLAIAMFIVYTRMHENFEDGDAAPADAAAGGEAAPAGGDALAGAVSGEGGAAATTGAYTEDAILKQARDTSGHTGEMLKNQQKERQYLIGSLTKEKKEREMDEEIAKQTYDKAKEAHERAKKNLADSKDLTKRSATAEVGNKPFDPKKAFATAGGEDPNAAEAPKEGGL
jgi:hypothetical protein